MQYKCDKCNDSGSLNKFSLYYDCTSCDAAEQRVALEKFRDELLEKGEGFDDIAFAIHQRALAMAPKQEEDDMQTIRERDYNAEMADKLADGIAEHFGADIGEHSSANCPWVQALGLLNTKPEFITCAGSKHAAFAVANGALTDDKGEALTDLKNAVLIGGVSDEWLLGFIRQKPLAAGPDAALADLLSEVSDVLAAQNWRGDLQERLRDIAALSGAKGN